MQPQRGELVRQLPANGSVAAWQEASIGTEANGLRLTEVLVNVGDRVQRGQVLARFAAETVRAEAAQIRAAVAEAELAEARANAARARELQTTGALSQQVIAQYLTAERTAEARLEAQRAAAEHQALRLRQTTVVAPDAGVISADLGALAPGQAVTLSPAPGQAVTGRVRMIAPTVDPQTRNGLVYVDLPASPLLRAGMFARGEFALGRSSALTLPQTAVTLRDGFHYVHRIGADGKVAETKVQVGRRDGERVEVTAGLAADARVRVVAAPPAVRPPGPAASVPR
ncbi:efflux RND transporter periplasmic adaptor subunit [Piscinibacter sakaiensis]|uniref:efflux RND transporter periplasmic adaptor subunit n=1 Tax=Piscinibacter sakaiensis TaxID=1547922 RepID=UPI0037276A1E